MAWLFSLSAECGGEREAAEHFGRAFAGKAVGGHPTQVAVFEGAGAFWCRVVVDDIDTSDEGAAERRAIGGLLRDRLRDAPAFRFAHVGVEVDLFRGWDELVGERFNHPAMDGVVLSEAAYRHAGSPAGFEPFRPGYVWRSA